MQDKIYPLRTVLNSFTNYKKPKLKKRLIFDKGAFGKLGSKWLIGFFFLLPLVEYAAIFNPVVFPYLGIAQAIVLFIVFLSIIMIIIFAFSSYNNNSVIETIRPSWEHYFTNIELKLVTTSGATPYKSFYVLYEKILNRGVTNENLHSELEKAFEQMQEENHELIEAMARDKNRKHHK